MAEKASSDSPKGAGSSAGFLSGGGEMGKLIREFNWESTSIGPIASWPQSLLTTLGIILKSKFPMVLLWGESYVFFYNDAYRPTLGNENKHPHVLGKPGSEIWGNAWHAVQPLIDRVFYKGESILLEDQLIPVFRNGRTDDVYWTFSYIPVTEFDKTAGVFITCLETTDKIVKLEKFEDNSRSLNLAMEIAELGIFKVDLNTYRAVYSHQIMEFLGLSQQNLPLSEIFERISPEDRARVNEVIERTISGESEGKHDIIYRAQNPTKNEVRYLHSIGQVVWSDGKPVLISGIIQDVSQEMISKKLLEEREKAFRNLVMRAPVAIAVFRGSNFVADIVNEAYLMLIGKTRQEFTDKPLFDSLPQARKVLEPVAREVLRSGKPYTINELKLKLHRNNSEETCWFDTVWEPTQDVGSQDGLMMVAHEITDQVLLRKRIEESEERYRTLIEESSVATGLYLGRELRIRYANDILLEYWGKDRSALGQPLDQAVPELLGQPFLKYLDDVFNTGKTYEGREELAELLVNGKLQTFYFNFIYKALRDNQGNIYGIHHMAIDVTGEVIARQALKESNDRFQAAVEAIDGTLWTNSAEGEMTGIQSGWASITGQKYEEYQGYGWARAVHPDDRLATINAWQEALLERKTFVFEHRLRLKDGNWGHFSIRALPLFDTEGNIREWVGVHTNITDQKSAALALKESESRFRSLADQAPMFVFIVEPVADARVSYFNKTWLKYTGQTFEEAIKKAWDGTVHPDELQLLRDEYEAAFEHRHAYTIPPVRLRRHDGKYRWHIFKGNPRQLPDGEFIGFVGVGIDVHEQKLALDQLEINNDQLKRINNDLDNFIYTASHDLKSPMSNIEGLLNILRINLQKKSELLSPDTEKILAMMEKSVDRFKTTILDLTEVSKAQRALEEDIREVNLEEIIEDVKLSIQDKIDESKAQIETDFSSVYKINFSRKNIKSIIYNLLSNAIKYRDAKKTPKITFKTEINKNELILIVKDNGLGIAAINHQKIFSMFKRFHDHVEGSGVGLYIVKRIIDNAGGRIEVESEVGKGTTFKIYFAETRVQIEEKAAH